MQTTAEKWGYEYEAFVMILKKYTFSYLITRIQFLYNVFYMSYLYNDDKDHLESMHDIILLHMVGRKINKIITSILTDYSLTMIFVSLASFYKLFLFYATIKVNQVSC